MQALDLFYFMVLLSMVIRYLSIEKSTLKKYKKKLYEASNLSNVSSFYSKKLQSKKYSGIYISDQNLLQPRLDYF